jgi:hypothetical protein
MVGVTDPGISGAWLGWGSYFIWIYMVISTYSNGHISLKNLIWTSSYSPFWSSWSDLSFAPFFRVWRHILFPASGVDQGYSNTKFSSKIWAKCGVVSVVTLTVSRGFFYQNWILPRVGTASSSIRTRITICSPRPGFLESSEVLGWKHSIFW